MTRTNWRRDRARRSAPRRHRCCRSGAGVAVRRHLSHVQDQAQSCIDIGHEVGRDLAGRLLVLEVLPLCSRAVGRRRARRVMRAAPRVRKRGRRSLTASFSGLEPAGKAGPWQLRPYRWGSSVPKKGRGLSDDGVLAQPTREDLDVSEGEAQRFDRIPPLVGWAEGRGGVRLRPATRVLPLREIATRLRRLERRHEGGGRTAGVDVRCADPAPP